MIRPFHRRNLLKSFVSIPAAVLGYFIYKEVKKGDGKIRTIGAPDLPEPSPLVWSVNENSYDFFVLGDTGLASKNRQAVLKQLHLQSRRVHPNSYFLVGDNFYDKGVKSTSDELWETHFERPFSASRFPAPFYTCLGNHDYYGNIAAQVEYSQINPRWRMPHPYYSFIERINESTDVQFFVLDTTPIEEGDHSTRAQINWLKEKLASSTADYKIVLGHHPLYTGGEHGRSRRNYRHLAKLFESAKIDLYICGHDHDLQLHDTKKGWLHLVSGSGSKLRTVSWTDTTLFAQATSGFARVSLTSDALGIEIYSTDGLLYTHEQKKVLANSAKLVS